MKTYEFEIACTATNTTDIIISNCPKEAIISFTKKNPDTIHWSKTIIDTRVISETVNSNQALIDEYRGLIESMELEVQERKQKLYNRHAVQIHDRLEREYEESKIRLDERKQFITKLEAVK